MFDPNGLDPVRMFLTDEEISDPVEERQFFSSEKWLNRLSLQALGKEFDAFTVQADIHSEKAEIEINLARDATYAAKALLAILKLQTELERRFNVSRDNK